MAMPETRYTNEPRRTETPRRESEHEIHQRQREETRAASFRERWGYDQPSVDAQRLALHATGESPEALALSALAPRTGASGGNAESAALDALDAAILARVDARPELRAATGGGYGAALDQLTRERHPAVVALEHARAGRGAASTRRTHIDEHTEAVEQLRLSLACSSDEAIRRFSRGEPAGSTGGRDVIALSAAAADTVPLGQPCPEGDWMMDAAAGVWRRR
jgi:hypothetical protein